MHAPDSPRLARNNFDLLRLLLAGTVAAVHAYLLSGYPELAWIADILSSEVAVKAFFVVSGFLIFMSYERSSAVASYAGKRIRRIYPAYFTVVLLCALGLFAVSRESPGDYFFSPEWVQYVLANLAFLNFVQPSLPGVFDSGKVAAVNGALWTLKIEAMFYVAVPVLVFLFRRAGHLRVIATVYVLSVAYEMLLTLAAERTGSGVYLALGRQLPGQLSYFMAGAFLYYRLDLFERRAGWFMLAAVPVLMADLVRPLPLLEPFALATVVVFFGLFRYLGNFGKHGDFSYGVYIVHFPIVQLLLHWGVFEGAPWQFLLAAALLTALAAFALWHLVEKRFLRRDSHYVAATQPSGGARVTGSPGVLERSRP